MSHNRNSYHTFCMEYIYRMYPMIQNNSRPLMQIYHPWKEMLQHISATKNWSINSLWVKYISVIPNMLSNLYAQPCIVLPYNYEIWCVSDYQHFHREHLSYTADIFVKRSVELCAVPKYIVSTMFPQTSSAVLNTIIIIIVIKYWVWLWYVILIDGECTCNYTPRNDVLPSDLLWKYRLLLAVELSCVVFIFPTSIFCCCVSGFATGYHCRCEGRISLPLHVPPSILNHLVCTFDWRHVKI